MNYVVLAIIVLCLIPSLLVYPWLTRSLQPSSTAISGAMAFLRREQVDEASDGLPQALDGALSGFSQECLQLREGVLDGVEIRTVRREVAQCANFFAAAGYDAD